MDAVLRDALHVDLHTFSGAAERWAQRKASGLTDAQLRSAIGQEFGLQGGHSFPGRHSSNHIGGSNPRFYFGLGVPHNKPTLHGQALLDAVRELLALPLPGHQMLKQLNLFD